MEELNKLIDEIIRLIDLYNQGVIPIEVFMSGMARRIFRIRSLIKRYERN